MNVNELEEEIQNEAGRIHKRQSDMQKEIEVLDSKIITFTRWAWMFVVSGFVLLIFSSIYFFVKTKEDGFTLNLLGDFLSGSVASIWSLAGLFFIYVAFLGQKQQLLNQQIEIMYSQLEVKYTRLELEGQKNEMIEQNKTLRQQRFENTFFQLLRNHQDIVNGIDIRTQRAGKEHTVSSQGRDCFKPFYKGFRDKITKSTPIEESLVQYLKFFTEHQSDLGHYFRNMYHILKFVHQANEIEEENKFKYTGLLRALLSSYELALLFYNGLSKNGKDHFKPLIEKYSFLKNIDRNLIINPSHFDQYDGQAFASSAERAAKKTA